MTDNLLERLLRGEQRALSRAITMVERMQPEVADLMSAVNSHTGEAYTIGITGPPGAGKSTLVTELTKLLRDQDKKVGIIAVDPTSPFSGGAILGDRIRMQNHYMDAEVFIRSVATRGQSGGLSRVVKTLTRLLDASGKDIIILETVGVGQTEVSIMQAADSVLVALVPESGDSIQALKAGLMEIADLYIVNKSDRSGADQLASAITNTIQLASPIPPWTPPVIMTQANTGKGLDDVWENIKNHQEYLIHSSELDMRRSNRRKHEYLETVEEEMGRRLRATVENDKNVAGIVKEVEAGAQDPYAAAMELINASQGISYLDI